MSRRQIPLRRDGCWRRSLQISVLDNSWKLHGDKKRCLLLGATDDEKDHVEEKPSNTREKMIKEKHKRVTKSPDYKHFSTSNDRSSHLERNANFRGYPPNNDKSSTESPYPVMPEKRMLELVIDILQRRDRYEIFAEPVDPKEVEDYYEIIKEPMDFGTMRAKLHEGMYATLEQFEHDALLIPLNAMHFNSTATIFYRQARAIYELAKKVFHVLKNDPKNFESEFSGTRRRSARRSQVHVNSYNFTSGLELGTNERSSTVKDPYSKGRPHTLNGPLRSSQKYHGFSRKDSYIATKDNDSTTGARDARTSSCEANRRYTYEPNYNNYFGSVMNNVPKQLTQVNYSYIGYKESLMRFVEDLGPAAQMIANHKLQELSKAADLEVPTASSNCWDQIAVENNAPFPSPASDFASSQKCNGILDTATADNTYQDLLALKPGSLLKTVIDLTDADDGYGDGENTGSFATNMASENITLGGKLAANQVEGSNSRECDKVLKCFSMLDQDKVIREKQLNNTQVSLFPPISRAGDLLSSSFTSTITYHGSKSAAPTLNLGEPDIKMQQQRQSPMLTFEDFSSQCNRPNGLSNTSAAAKSNQHLPVVSQFAFDLPFLESRLNQMKSHSGLNGRSSSGPEPSNNNTTSVYNHLPGPGTKMMQLAGTNNNCALFPDTNLSLQL